MSTLTHVMLHYLETPEGKYFDKEDVLDWHCRIPKDQGGRGWSKPGYSGGWKIDGEFEILVPFDDDEIVDGWELSNGAAGWNGITRHFYYVGGLRNGKPADTRTPEQLAAMATGLQFMLIMWPDVKFIGHNQVNAHKACPGFSVPDWCAAMGIPEANIDRKIYY